MSHPPPHHHQSSSVTGYDNVKSDYPILSFGERTERKKKRKERQW